MIRIWMWVFLVVGGIPAWATAQVNISVLETYVSTSQSATHETGSFTPSGTNRALIVCLTNDSTTASGPAATSMAFNTSETMTQLIRESRSSLWWLANPSNTSATISYTVEATTASTATVMLVTNANQTTPTLTDSEDCVSPCSSNTVNASITTVVANTLLVTCAYSNADSATFTHGAGQTELTETSNTTAPDYADSTSYITKVSPGVQAVSSTATSSNRMTYAVAAIAPAGVAVRRFVSPLLLP